MPTANESPALHPIESPHDFEKVMNILEVDMPSCANTFTSLKLWRDGTIKSINHRFFAFPWPDPVCFMAIRYNNYIDLQSIFFYAEHNEAHRENLILFFKELEQAVPELFWKRELYFECNRAVDTDAMKDYISQFGRFEPLPRDSEPSLSFFVPKEKWNDLLRMDIQPPDGYYFDSLKESDIQTVSETWRFRLGDDYIHMKFKFDHLPTACLRSQSDNALAAFEMIDASGFMTHLFTFPQHRNKGLAKVVQLKLAQKLVAINVTPFSCTLSDNEAGIALSQRSNWFQPMEGRRWHNFYPNSSSA